MIYPILLWIAGLLNEIINVNVLIAGSNKFRKGIFTLAATESIHM